MATECNYEEFAFSNCRKRKVRWNFFGGSISSNAGALHAAPALDSGDGLTTDKALADERETIKLMRDGQERGRPVMHSWMVSARLHKGPLTHVQREAVKLILSAKDRVVGVQGDWASKLCSSSGRIDTKKITSGAMSLAAAQANQQSRTRSSIASCTTPTASTSRASPSASATGRRRFGRPNAACDDWNTIESGDYLITEWVLPS